MNKKFASSIDVARLAGVSQSTVSRAFRNHPSVLKSTAENVMKAADSLGYRPSLLPRIMLTQQSKLVALVVGGLQNPYYASVIEMITPPLKAMGCQILLVHADCDDALDSMVPTLSGYRVDVVISALPILSEDTAKQLVSLRVPVISFNNNQTLSNIYSVGGDNVDAGREVARHLVAMGGKRIAFFGGPEQNPANLDRQRGFVEELRVLGHNVDVYHSDFTYNGGAALAQAAFSKETVPDSVFCANDLIAIGLLDTLTQDKSLVAPERLRVVGFDDIPQALWAPYNLSSFRQDTNKIVNYVLDIVASQYLSETTLAWPDARFKGRLVVRASSLGGVVL